MKKCKRCGRDIRYGSKCNNCKSEQAKKNVGALSILLTLATVAYKGLGNIKKNS